MKETVIKTSSYTKNFPNRQCVVKVAVKPIGYEIFDEVNECIKTEIFNTAMYCGGFVSIDGGKSFYLANKFLFHKLKRKYNENKIRKTN